VAHATALLSNLQIAEANLAEDAKGLNGLAIWCLKKYSPLVAVDPPDGLWLDITGCAGRFGGEAELLRDLINPIRSSGIEARAAIADTTGAAHAVARYGDEAIIASDAHPAALHSLPIRALRLPYEIADGLHELGFSQIGQLYNVARAPLARRFGIDLMRRYDQAVGNESEPLKTITLTDTPTVKRFFPEPVTHQEYIAKVLSGLVEALCKQLEQKGLGAHSVDVIANRVDNRTVGFRVAVGQSSHDAPHWLRLLTDKIPNIDTGYGIEALELRATHSEKFQHRQTLSALGNKTEADTDSLTDILVNRVGSSRVYRLQSVESHVPERSFKRISASKNIGLTQLSRWPRPSLVLSKPEAMKAIALLPDNAPTYFTWRGRRYAVRLSDGPERLFGEWWKRNAEVNSVRDYFLVEDTNGKRFWIFRRGDGLHPETGSQEWFMHGFFA